MHSTLIGLSGLLAFLSPLSYIVSIIRGTSKPHRMTRFAILVVLTLNAVSIYDLSGVNGAFWLATTYGAQSAVIFGLCLLPEHGVGGTSKIDLASLLVVLLGLCGWRMSGDPFVGLLCFVAADFAAYIPAVLKTWRAPDTESHWTYTLSVLSASAGLLADGFAATSLFLAYLVCIGLVMIACINSQQLQRLPLLVRETRAQRSLDQKGSICLTKTRVTPQNPTSGDVAPVSAWVSPSSCGSCCTTGLKCTKVCR